MVAAAAMRASRMARARVRISSAVRAFFLFSGSSLLGIANILLTRATIEEDALALQE